MIENIAYAVIGFALGGYIFYQIQNDKIAALTLRLSLLENKASVKRAGRKKKDESSK